MQVAQTAGATLWCVTYFSIITIKSFALLGDTGTGLPDNVQ